MQLMANSLNNFDLRPSARDTFRLLIALAATTLLVAVSNAEVRPIAHFGFDEPVKDQFTMNSIGDDGLYIDNPFFPIQDIPNGVFGRAVEYGTSCSYSLLPSSGIGGVIDSLTEFSVTGWVNKPHGGSSVLIGQLGDSVFGWRINIGAWGPGTVALTTPYRTTGNSTSYFNSSPVFDPFGGFQYLAITYASDFAKLYVNGNLVRTEVVYGVTAPSGSDYFIGNEFDKFTPSLSSGSFDEIWIYDGVLSEAQVREVMLTNRLVPEPATWFLALIGACGSAYVAQRFRCNRRLESASRR